MGRDTLTCQEARDLHNDDMPRFMASTPTQIGRKYGWVDVTQEDIDSATEEIKKDLTKK